MRRRKFIIGLLIAMAGIMLCFACSLEWFGRTAWQPPHVVAIEGAKECSVNPFPTMVFSPVQEGQPIHLPLRDGDLVAANGFPFPYRNSDGRYLSVAGDEIQGMLNGKTVSLNLDKDKAWEWLEKAASEDLDGLRLLLSSKYINETQFALLKRLSARNSNLDVLFVENPNWRQVLAMFDPEWLAIEANAVEAEDHAMLAAKKQIRTLWIDGKADISFLSQMQGCDTLAISGWDPGEAGPLANDLGRLKHLHLPNSKVKDLTPLGQQPNLEELSLAESAVDDLGRLANFPQLKVLNLTGCEKLADLAPLKQLKRLKWLSLPPTTTQQQLVEIVHDHPDLVGLELYGTENITDLTPLKDLRHLEYLLAGTPNVEPEPLYEMKRLKWLAVSKEKKTADEEPQGEDLAVKLQEALPQTAIVGVARPCLGSGWILLLVPAIGLAWLVEKWRNPNAFAAGTKGGRV